VTPRLGGKEAERRRALRKLLCPSPLAKPTARQSHVLAEKQLLIKQDYATLRGGFLMCTKVHRD